MCTCKVWFQNRRAKWRKQARLQLLQDAWRMRCLGLSNPPMVMSGSNRQQPYSSEASSPQSPPMAHSPPVTQQSSNSVPAAPNEPSEASGNGFTLMHPAFQAPHQSEKTTKHEKPTITKSRAPAHGLSTMTLGNHGTNPLAYSAEFSLKADYTSKLMSNGTHFADRANGHHDRERESGSADESDSEEIDLTSNGCIDFSNNNNNKCH